MSQVRDFDGLLPDPCPRDVTIARFETLVALRRAALARLVLAVVEGLRPLVPKFVFERGIHGTVGEFPRLVVGAQDIVPEVGVGVEIDVCKFFGSLGIDLTQQRLEFGSGNAESRTGFWPELGFKERLVEPRFDKPLGDRPAPRSRYEHVLVGDFLDGSDTIVDQQVTNLQQLVGIVWEVLGAVFEDELHCIVIAVQHDLGLEALEIRKAAITVEFLEERLRDLLAVILVCVLVGRAD